MNENDEDELDVMMLRGLQWILLNLTRHLEWIVELNKVIIKEINYYFYTGIFVMIEIIIMVVMKEYLQGYWKDLIERKIY